MFSMVSVAQKYWWSELYRHLLAILVQDNLLNACYKCFVFIPNLLEGKVKQGYKHKTHFLNLNVPPWHFPPQSS